MRIKIMDEIYIRELKHYTRNDLLNIINQNTFNNLVKTGLIKKSDDSYCFDYVGVIIADNMIINCYPKYIPDESDIKNDFTQTMRVIKKYKNHYMDADYQNDQLDDVSFNILSMMVFFLEDYYTYGVYSNTRNILEINGSGEINWDKTINTFNPIIDDNKPYYGEFYTKNSVDDLSDYFKLLHEYIITVSSKELEKTGLLEIFDITSVELSSKLLDDFGDLTSILVKIEKELNIEYNTHKRKLLKSMHSFLSMNSSFSNRNYLTLYGTGTYHVIWENICSWIFSNKYMEVKGYVKKPKWIHKTGKTHYHDRTFTPDIVTYVDDTFFIMDAKYYNLKFTDRELSNHPGLGDISKQYLYQLALNEYIESKAFSEVKNILLFPTYNDEVEFKGTVKIDVLSSLGLEDIQIVMLPVKLANESYLTNKRLKL